MASQKRSHEEVDPDYADACAQQTKRQRELEQDAKQAVIRRLQNIFRNEFQTEINNKEAELQQIDRRLNDAQLMLDRLRACLVANYYGRANVASSSQASNINAPPPSIHPTVKKHLGKKPAHQDCYPDSTNIQTQPDEKLENVSTRNSVDSALDSASSDSSGSQNTLHLTHLGRQTLMTQIPAPTPECSTANTTTRATSTIGATYDDRRARLKIKKKIIIGNVSKYIPVDHREPNDMSSHKWMVYVRGPKSDPDISGFVKKVWFFLHHSYKPNDLVEISSHPFHLTRRGWGEFPVRVQLHFVDTRNKKVDIIHHLKLDKTFTGLQTLGAETVVEVELERDFFESKGSITTSANTSSSLELTSLPAIPFKSQSSHGSHLLLPRADNTDNNMMEIDSTLQHDNTVKLEHLENLNGYGDGSNVRTDEGSAVNNGENLTKFEEFNVTIAHDTGGCEKLKKAEEEEETFVDICEESSKQQAGKISHLLSSQANSTATVTSLSSSSTTDISSCISTSAYKAATPASSSQYTNSRQDLLPADCQISCSSGNTTIVSAEPKNVKCVPLAGSHITYNSHAHQVKVVKDDVRHVSATLTTNSATTLTQQTSRDPAGVNSSDKTDPTLIILNAAPPIYSTDSSSSPNPSIENSSMSQKAERFSPSVPVTSANCIPQVSHCQASTTVPNPSLVLSKANSLNTKFSVSGVFPQTIQQTGQVPLPSSSTQKLIILNPKTPSLLAQRTPPTSLITKAATEGKTAALQKSSGPRQVSLLTGRIVTPHATLPAAGHISLLGNQKAVATSLLPSPNSPSLSQQVNNPDVSGSTNKIFQTTPKAASQVLLFSKPDPSSSFALSSTIQKGNQIPASSPSYSFITSARSPHTQSTVISDLGNTSVTNSQTLTQPQVLLLSTGPTTNVSSLLTGQKNQCAMIRPGTVQLAGQTQPHQNNLQASLHFPKMSAIGKTKHGSYSSQTLNPDKQAATAEERKRNQYEILRTWKENPELYQRNLAKGKKIVLAVKDMIEGEIDIIPELNPDDYPTMRSLIKAAVRLHPLIQADINKLTHPYCAQSLEQWNLWPVGKQRAAEWHRACFVLKYLKTCLGNGNEFRGEKLMRTRQLVDWCRQHAFSPVVVAVKRTRVKQEMREMNGLAFASDSHQPSYSHRDEIESQLTVQTATTASNLIDTESSDLDILEMNSERKTERQIKLEPSSASSGVEWLPVSEGAGFVHDELRKRGIKLSPQELRPGVTASTVEEMIFSVMQEFSADILRESLAVCAQSDNIQQVTRQDVCKALTSLPEAAFCCNRFLGKDELEGR